MLELVNELFGTTMQRLLEDVGTFMGLVLTGIAFVT